MCAIFGFLTDRKLTDDKEVVKTEEILNTIANRSFERGRDGIGMCRMSFYGKTQSFRNAARTNEITGSYYKQHTSVLIGNCRAEPTTEYVKEKTIMDQQPYECGDWIIVHNGTIANDKELRNYKLNTQIDSAAICEKLDAESVFNNEPAIVFESVISQLKGSYAILAMNKKTPTTLYGAVNYRPIWYISTDIGLFFASSRYAFPKEYPPQMITPYSWFKIDDYQVEIHSMRQQPNKKALVVCSGGLDSVVAATLVQREANFEITLLHFEYGSRAQGPELIAVERVAEALRAPLVVLNIPVYGKTDSPLLNADSPIAGGEAGAEFAYEWVPARNLVMLSIATAYAEAHGFDTIVLGNNMEEAGAYPDNEPEFIERFNDMLPFAVGANKYIEVVMPVGNMMKHEIVHIGKQIDAPMHLTWSCYRSGQKHCGKCGPCYMRRKAFEINNLPEVIEYEE